MRKSKILPLLVLTLFFLSPSLGLNASIQPVEREAKHDDPAQFRITIENSFPEDTKFQLSSIQSPSSTENWISYDRYMEVEAGGTESFLINVTPPKNALEGNYRFKIGLRDYVHDDFAELSDYFTVSSDKPLKVVSYNVSKSRILPGEKIGASTTLKNVAQESISQFQVKADFLNRSSTKKGYELPSGAKLTLKFSLKAPKDSKPGENDFTISLNSTNQFERFSQTVEVAEVRNISKSSRSENFVLFETQSLSAENEGNVEADAKINATLPEYLSALVVFNPKPDTVRSSGGEKVYIWSLNLQPGEEKTVEYTLRYWIPLLLLLVVLGLFLAFKRLQNPVEISKSTVNKEDGLKVVIELKNKSGHELENLTVKDYIPDLASLDREFELVPPVVRKTADATELEWDIESMKPGETRMLEYLIYPAVEVEEGVRLPSAEVESDGDIITQTEGTEAEFEP